MANTCSTCKFFDTTGEGSAPVTSSPYGVCRFNPPMPIGRGPSPGGWTTVNENDWCSNFQI